MPSVAGEIHDFASWNVSEMHILPTHMLRPCNRKETHSSPAADDEEIATCIESSRLIQLMTHIMSRYHSALYGCGLQHVNVFVDSGQAAADRSHRALLPVIARVDGAPRHCSRWLQL